jgi:hypothetical protein
MPAPRKWFAIAISRLRPWHNILKPLDSTGNGIIAPADAIFTLAGR